MTAGAPPMASATTLRGMEHIGAGDLVKVATGGPLIDGIVFDATGGAKVVVAVVDRQRGPVMRTFSALDALTERTGEGPDDHALQLLIRRTPHGVRGAARAGAGPARRPRRPQARGGAPDDGQVGPGARGPGRRRPRALHGRLGAARAPRRRATLSVWAGHRAAAFSSRPSGRWPWPCGSSRCG